MSVALSLHHVSVIVTDLERSAAFYQQLFGLEPIARPPFKVDGMWLGVGDRQVHLRSTSPATSGAVR